MPKPGRDLFSALRVSTPGITHDNAPSPDGLCASRVDVGWTAWRARTLPAQAPLRQRCGFFLKRWQHFGKAQFLVQVDDSYHTATSVCIRHLPDQDSMDIQLIQTTSFWRFLLGQRQLRLGKATLPWRKRLNGRVLLISRYPATLDAASLPDVSALGVADCAEVLVDGRHASQLPLRISCSD